LHSKPCSRCRVAPASTPGTAYCKPCRAAYQRAWRARKKGGDAVVPAETPAPPAEVTRLRATPTREELARLRLL
jgi:hypothetical protein